MKVLRGMLLCFGALWFITLVGCAPSQEEIEKEKAEKKAMDDWNSVTYAPTRGEGWVKGKVTKIAGTLPGLVHSSISGKDVSGETIKLGEPTYILHVQADQDFYVVQITYSEGPQNIYNLESVIGVGDEIEFPTMEHISTSHDPFKRFSDGKIGMVKSNYIKIIPKK